MAEESGVEREDAPALNIGETAVVGVADADCSALARPRVTRMADVRGTLGWGKRGGGQVLRGGAEKRRDATRRARTLFMVAFSRPAASRPAQTPADSLPLPHRATLAISTGNCIQSWTDKILQTHTTT